VGSTNTNPFRSNTPRGLRSRPLLNFIILASSTGTSYRSDLPLELNLLVKQSTRKGILTQTYNSEVIEHPKTYLGTISSCYSYQDFNFNIKPAPPSYRITPFIPARNQRADNYATFESAR